MPIHLSNNTRRYLILFGIFWLMVLVWYRNALHAHFNDDFIAGIKVYLEQGPKGFLTSFDFPSLYYGHNLFFYGFYILFGLNEYAWHLYITGLHAINAVLIVMVIESLLQRYAFSNSKAAALISALFFVASPYQTENVVWCATIHYQIGMIVMLSGILLVRNFVQTNRAKYILFLCLAFALSLVTIEMALVFPFVWTITYLLYNGNVSKQTITTFAKWLLVPCTLLVILYFSALRLLKGIFVPHYGSEIHLANWSPQVVLACFTKYLLKLLAFIHFGSHHFREKLYTLCDNGWVLVILWIGLLTVITYLYLTRHKREAVVIVILLLLAFITLLPSLNMYFMYVNRIENDRLSFFSLPFIYLLPAFLITRFKPIIWIPFATAILILMVCLLNIQINSWVSAAEIQKRTLDSFHFEGKKRLFIVNLPVNFNGAYIYRSYWRFPAAMKVLRSRDIAKQLEVVVGQDLFDLNDGVTVTATDSVTYKIHIDGSGWFWNNVYNTDGQGNGYTFDAKDGWCTLRLNKPLASDEAIIYQNGGYWMEAKRWIPLNQ